MTFKCWVLDVVDAFEGEEERTQMNATADGGEKHAGAKVAAKAKASNKRPSGPVKSNLSSGKNIAVVQFLISCFASFHG